MDKGEAEVHAQHHKDRTDLNERHANMWGKFLKRKNEYAQKYGAGYADILLRKERETLEVELKQDLLNLSEQHDQQWMAYHENPSLSEKPSPYLGQSEPALNHAANDTKNTDKQTTQTLFDQSKRSLFSNPFKQTEQKQVSPSETKGLTESQERMNAMRSATKTNQAKEKSAEPEMKSASMSSRFSQGLSFNRATELSSRSAERSKDIDRD